MGGNMKLKNFFANFKIPEDVPTDFKYKTKAGQYYRDLLKSLVENSPQPDMISPEDGIKPLEIKNPIVESNTPIENYQQKKTAKSTRRKK